MFIKYILLPDVTKDAKIGYVVLHPKKSVMGLEVFDSQHEVFIVEYSYHRQAIPASTTAREMAEAGDETLKLPGQARDEGLAASEGQRALT
jgi:hypothetical protein